MSSEPAGTLVVIAKEPLPGRAKTRLQAAFDPEQTAALAQAALRDTLRAVRRSRISRKILYWQGFPATDPSDAAADPATADDQDDDRDDDRYDDGFDVVPQVEGGLADRLAHVFCVLRGAPGESVLLVGMDTPQLRTDQLETDWDGADAVLGLAADGGFWAIGLRGSVDPHAVFADIPMSTDRTGAAQLGRLHDLGLEVRLLPPLRDVDTPADAAAVARAYPDLGFSRLHDRLLAERSDETRPTRAFDLAYGGSRMTVRTDDGLVTLDPLRVDVAHWSGVADEVDGMLLTRCRPPVLDLGCGPGRLVVALQDQGVAALGIDLSGAAVQAVRDRGAQALQRDLHERLPLEGGWGSVVLLDSNLGIGGDVEALLRRCVELVAPGGVIICEVDPDPTARSTHQVELSAGGYSAVLPWSRYGSVALVDTARSLDLVVAEEWSAGGRTFVSLERA